MCVPIAHTSKKTCWPRLFHFPLCKLGLQMEKSASFRKLGSSEADFQTFWNGATIEEAALVWSRDFSRQKIKEATGEHLRRLATVSLCFKYLHDVLKWKKERKHQFHISHHLFYCHRCYWSFIHNENVTFSIHLWWSGACRCHNGGAADWLMSWWTLRLSHTKLQMSKQSGNKTHNNNHCFA